MEIEKSEEMKRRFNKLVELLKTNKLKPKTNGFSDEELADENCIVNRLGGDVYTMRPGRSYGYLTKAEIALGRVNPSVSRITPPSWLDYWEKTHGQPYYGLRDDGTGTDF
jgi:hypothetical protein